MRKTNLIAFSWYKSALAIWLWAGLTLLAPGKDVGLKTEANVMVELTFKAARAYADPFNEVTLDAVFFDPKGRELRVPAFWAGADVWKVRYASPVVGTHRFRTACSEAGDKGLHNVTGKVEVGAYQGQNPLYTHGPIRVAANRRYLEHLDGTPFFWLGDTWWMGLCHRLRWPDEFKQLTADRKAKGFNVIQIVAGLYPDMPPFDPRGANEAGFPWSTNYTGIRPEYFNAADDRFRHLVEQGFTPCIVGAWGYFIPWMGVEKAKQHWRYLIARYGAWPVLWCVAGEANLPYYLAKGFPYDDREQVKSWTEVTRYLRETDPFHRLITIHPTGINRLSARNATEEISLLDIDLLQTPHGQAEAVPPTVRTVRESYADEPVLPVINGEASYEMLMDKIPADWPRAMFWVCLLNGAAGHTYGANGIWQCNRHGQPHGPSPNGDKNGVGYGTITWDEAMNLAGSGQVALGKQLLAQYPWHRFTPHREWAAFTNQAEVNLDKCPWIWTPEAAPAQDAPAEKRFFRKLFKVPRDKVIARAGLFVSADAWFSAQLNAEPLGSGDNLQTGKLFDDLARRLKSGTNVLAITAETKPVNGSTNSAGLIACLEIHYADGETLRLMSDESWRSAKSPATNWDTAGFDDSAWAAAAKIGRFGDKPWGKIGGPSELEGPQAAGIPGAVRIIWAPRAEPIVLRHLGSQATWAAAYFDPVGGGKTALTPIQASAEGSWICPPPTGHNHDWVLILEPKAKAQASSLQQEPGTARPDRSRRLTLANDQLAWHLDWSEGRLRSTSFENKLSGHRFLISAPRELALNFSAALDRVQEPVTRVADFEVTEGKLVSDQHAVFELHSPALALEVRVHYQLEGATRRKWVEAMNQSGRELLLLDVELDDFTTEGATSGGGRGQPVFVEGEFFAALEHPAGVNSGDQGRIQLRHHPGRRWLPEAAFKSQVALVSVAPLDQAQGRFTDYIDAHSLRKKKALAIYAPFGINNQWGACPTLDDEQTLDVLGVLGQWQRKGMKFDYFTLDCGWVDPNSDLTRFRPTCFPNGPGRIVERVSALGMNFGLWFASSWAAESCWNYPPALVGQQPIAMPYRLGYPDKAHEGRMFCLGLAPYFNTFSNAVIHHIRENHARFIKIDGGDYFCDSAEHGHLPGKYATEFMHEQLIALARAARAESPDVFVLWYWGCKSPFWALHGDAIFESGLDMEGSGTSAFPTLHYRDSVSLEQDHSAQHARNIPPIAKDSLGVWLADTRWGNFMGTERWREALVMDLGRGSLLFPNLWGNLYHLTDDDVSFLARLTSLARKNESLFLHRRNILGDPARNEVYGYAHCQGTHGFLFLNNAHFAARKAELRLDQSLGLDAKPGAPLRVVSHFPEATRLLRPDQANYKAGDALEIWLRPFETLMLEVTPAAKSRSALPTRAVTQEPATALGGRLALHAAPSDERLEVRFADAARLEREKKLTKKTYGFETTLPSLAGEPPTLAVVVRLRKGSAEWRYSPVVTEIAQARVRIGDQDLQLIPVPDGRQFGNTQNAGCSWVVFKTRLSPLWTGQRVKLAVHACLPEGVEAQVEAWVVKRWWEDNPRPMSDGYYNDAPS
jgi:hypothetical protein